MGKLGGQKGCPGIPTLPYTWMNLKLSLFNNRVTSAAELTKHLKGQGLAPQRGNVCLELGLNAELTGSSVDFFLLKDHSENPLGAAVTLAHELGHNFGMNHDTLERGCNCKASTDKGGCIMNPSTG